MWRMCWKCWVLIYWGLFPRMKRLLLPQIEANQPSMINDRGPGVLFLMPHSVFSEKRYHSTKSKNLPHFWNDYVAWLVLVQQAYVLSRRKRGKQWVFLSLWLVARNQRQVRWRRNA